MAFAVYRGPPAKPKVYTLFELKVLELEDLKSEARKQLNALNALKLEYRNWFERARQTFVDALKLIETSLQQDISTEPTTIASFRRNFETARAFTKKNMLMQRSVLTMESFMKFWLRFVALHKQGQIIHKKIKDFCSCVRKMGDPELIAVIDRLQDRLNRETGDSFNCLRVRHSTDNLFTYKVANYECRYHGLLSYIPYLLNMSSTICFLIGKMFLEKE